MNELRCPSCGLEREISDNFCRRCGRQITVNLPEPTSANLPVIRTPDLPAAVRALPPSLIGSVAVLALGTGLEWAARRLSAGAARGVARAAGRALINKAGGREESAQVTFVEEVLYV